MTIQPAIDEPFFEMEDAYRWFSRRHTRIEIADLMSLSALDPPPGYADIQAQRMGAGKTDIERLEWYHFRISRLKAAPTLAVVMGLYKMVQIASGGKDSIGAMWTLPPPKTWRVWLYEHRQGQGWVCLDPADESHEVVRRLRAEMVLEALR